MRNPWFKLLLFAAGSCLLTHASAAEPLTGPAIAGYGPVYPVPGNSFNLAKDQVYKVVMDVSAAPEDPAAINRSIESAARFLNMHARSGVQPGNLHLAIVLHGSAAAAALGDAAHQRHFGVANGSKGLLEALGEAGVTIYLCAQSAGYRGYEPDDLLPQVTLAVSAMTAHVRLQQEGYRAVLF